MRKRKKEISVKVSKGVLGKIFKAVSSVKSFIFPPKMIFYIKEGNAVSPAMSRRQIKNVAMQICRTAVTAAKGRGY